MNPASRSLARAGWPDKAALLHGIFENVLPTAGQIEISGRDGAACVDFNRTAADKDWRTITGAINVGTYSGQQAQGSFELGPVHEGQTARLLGTCRAGQMREAIYSTTRYCTKPERSATLS